MTTVAVLELKAEMRDINLIKLVKCKQPTSALHIL